jgi:hypothetical protein
MTLTRGNKIIIIIVGGLIVIGLLVYFGFFYGQTPTPAELGNKVYSSDEVVPTKTLTFTPPPLTETEILENTLQVLSRTFAERFGTYSSQGNGRLVTDLKPLMTKKFYDWAIDSYTDKLRAEYYNGGVYASVVTTVNIVQVLESTATTATVTVSTSRVKNSTGTNAITTMEDLKLEYVKNGDSWLVDGAYWTN